MAKSTAKLAKARGGTGIVPKAAAVAVALAGLAALPVFLVLLPGMMPAFVTLFVDRQRPRHLSYTVGVMNFAGVLPFILTLAKNGASLKAAAGVLADPLSWLVMYGAAASGWLICGATPPLARLCLELQASQKRRALEALGKAIREEWGDEVAGAQLPAKERPAAAVQAERDRRP
jgi:hypothetical protein